ncbi:hypothetical protein Csa_022196 [Cucumis sativus]|uniref:Uncharacterized protein n=1 Tax=Cucumis sativus TaxID=3659 RepID=A0A0A0LT80_CUCSA|nr:hypothetical protein Csa_022196 [Cucumis sativus]
MNPHKCASLLFRPSKPPHADEQRRRFICSSASHQFRSTKPIPPLQLLPIANLTGEDVSV